MKKMLIILVLMGSLQVFADQDLLAEVHHFLSNQLQTLLKEEKSGRINQYGMAELRKWRLNHPELVKEIERTIPN